MLMWENMTWILIKDIKKKSTVDTIDSIVSILNDSGIMVTWQRHHGFHMHGNTCPNYDNWPLSPKYQQKFILCSRF